MIISSSTPPPQPATKKRRPRRRALSGLTFWASIFYVVSLLAIALLIWQFGDRWWPATGLLFSPRWTMALPMLALVPLALFRSRKSLIALTAAAARLAWPIMGL